MSDISAIILAAGKSTRMGQQKMLMPWGDTTVLGKVIHTIRNAGINDIIIVTNETIANSITNLQLPITLNDNGDMLSSMKIGLRTQKPSVQATLVCLGDQPQIEEGSVRSVCDAFVKSRSNLVVPSYQMRRGHPWLVARPLWDDVFAMQGGSMREFLNAQASQIEYVNLETETILQDIDTPEDYLKYKPSL